MQQATQKCPGPDIFWTFCRSPCPCCNAKHAGELCCCRVSAMRIHCASEVGIMMHFCATASCRYAVTLEQGRQVYSFPAECRTAALHRAKHGMPGPVCMGITHQDFAYLFESAPAGRASVTDVLALQPGRCGFPVLDQLLRGPEAESVCQQVRLYSGEANALRSTFCTGQAASLVQPCQQCNSIQRTAKRRARDKQNLLARQHDLVHAGSAPSLSRGQPDSMTHAELRLHHRQDVTEKHALSVAHRVCSWLISTVCKFQLKNASSPAHGHHSCPGHPVVVLEHHPLHWRSVPSNM